MYWLLWPSIGWNFGLISARRVMLTDVPATVPPPPPEDAAGALAVAGAAEGAAAVGAAAVGAADGAWVGLGVALDEQAPTASTAAATRLRNRRGMPDLRAREIAGG